MFINFTAFSIHKIMKIRFFVHLEKILNFEINSATCEVIYILLLLVYLNRLVFS